MMMMLLLPLLCFAVLPEDSHLVAKRQISTTCLGGPPLYFAQDFEGLPLRSPAALPAGWTHDLSLRHFWTTQSSRSGDHTRGTPAGIFLSTDGTSAIAGCWDVGTDTPNGVAFVSAWYQVDAGITLNIHQSVDDCNTYSVPIFSASSRRASLWSMFSGTVVPSADGTVCLRFSADRPSSTLPRVALKLDDVVVGRTHTVAGSLHCPETIVVSSSDGGTGNPTTPTMPSAPTIAATTTTTTTTTTPAPSVGATPAPTVVTPTATGVTAAPTVLTPTVAEPSCCCFPVGSLFDCIVIPVSQCASLGNCNSPVIDAATPTAAPTPLPTPVPTPAPTPAPTQPMCCCYPVNSTINSVCVDTLVTTCVGLAGSCSRPFPQDPPVQQPPGPINNVDTIAPTAAPTRAPARQGCMDIGTTPLVVDQSSIDLVFANFGPCDPTSACITDVNLDTVTDQLDLDLLEANRGPLPDLDGDGLADNGCDSEVTILADENRCVTAADCSDGDACTDDFCVNGFCVHPQFECRGSPCRDIVCFSNPSGTIRQCIEQGNKPDGTSCISNDISLLNTTCQSGTCSGGVSFCDGIAGAPQVTVRGEVSPIHSTPPSPGVEGTTRETAVFEPQDFGIDIFVLETGCLADQIPDFSLIDLTYAVTESGNVAVSWVPAAKKKRDAKQQKRRKQTRTVKLVTVNLSDLARGARRSQSEILNWARQELGPRLNEVTLGKLTFTFEQFEVSTSHAAFNCNSGGGVSLLSSWGSCACCTRSAVAVAAEVGAADHLVMIFDDAYFGSSGFAGLGGQRGVWMPHEHLFSAVSLHEVFHSMDDLWTGTYGIPGHGNAFLKSPWLPAVYAPTGVTYNEYSDQACILGSSPWDVGLNAPMLDLLGLFSSSEIRTVGTSPQTLEMKSMYAESSQNIPRAVSMTISGIKYYFSHRGHSSRDKTAHLPRQYGAYWNNMHVNVGDQDRGNSFLLRRVQLGESWTDPDGTVTVSFTFASATSVFLKIERGLGVDSDGDGVVDSADLCPRNYNPRVQDIDQDGVPDACDSSGWRGDYFSLTRLNGVTPQNVQCIFQDPQYHCDIYWLWGACDTVEQSFVSGESVYCGADLCPPAGNVDSTGAELSDDIDTDGDLLLDCVDPEPLNPVSSAPVTGAPTTAQPTQPLSGACLVDIDGDGIVGTSDLSRMLIQWDVAGSEVDFDQSGVVDLGDLALLLSSFNQICT